MRETKGACTLAIVHTIEVPGLRVPFDVREHPELGLGVSVAQIHAASMHVALSETTRHLRHVGQATERELDESFVTLPVLWRVYDRSFGPSTAPRECCATRSTSSSGRRVLSMTS